MIYCENIVNVALFFLLLLRFRNHIFFPPFSVMPMPQLLQNFFFPYFGNGIVTISLSQFFFFSFHFGHSTHATHPVSRNWVEEFQYSHYRIQHFLSPFSSSFSYFLLNFGNGDTKIHSLSSQS